LSLFKESKSKKSEIFYDIVLKLENKTSITIKELRTRLKEFIQINLIDFTQTVINNFDYTNSGISKEDLRILIDERYEDNNISILIDKLVYDFKLYKHAKNSIDVNKDYVISVNDINILFGEYDFIFEFEELRNYFTVKFDWVIDWNNLNEDVKEIKLIGRVVY